MPLCGMADASRQGARAAAPKSGGAALAAAAVGRTLISHSTRYSAAARAPHIHGIRAPPRVCTAGTSDGCAAAAPRTRPAVSRLASRGRRAGCRCVCLPSRRTRRGRGRCSEPRAHRRAGFHHVWYSARWSPSRRLPRRVRACVRGGQALRCPARRPPNRPPQHGHTREQPSHIHHLGGRRRAGSQATPPQHRAARPCRQPRWRRPRLRQCCWWCALA
jgi:hypothetical protein